VPPGRQEHQGGGEERHQHHIVDVHAVPLAERENHRRQVTELDRRPPDGRHQRQGPGEPPHRAQTVGGGQHGHPHEGHRPGDQIHPHERGEVRTEIGDEPVPHRRHAPHEHSQTHQAEADDEADRRPMHAGMIGRNRRDSPRPEDGLPES
jgi:hypothetical protein